LLFAVGCAASFKAVDLGPGVDEKGLLRPNYAIVRNGVVIPEYVVDQFGNFPLTADEALRRYKERKRDLELFVQQKYDLSGAGGGEISRFFMGAGASLIAAPRRGANAEGSINESPLIGATGYKESRDPLHYKMPQIRQRVDIFY